MTFKHILIVSFIVFHVFGVRENLRADDLRNDSDQVPDSVKADMLVNVAKMYEDDQPDSCVFYALKASETARRAKNDKVLIDAETLLGRMASKNKEYWKAVGHLKVALDASLRIRDWNSAAQGYYDLAQVWLLQSNYAETIDHLKKGLAIAKERDNPELLRDYYQSLITVYQKLNNLNAVSEYYPLLIEANHQVDTKALNDQITALRTEYDVRASVNNRSENTPGVVSESGGGKGIFIAWAILATLLSVAAVVFYRRRAASVNAKNKKALDDAIHETETIKNNQGALFGFLSQYAYTGIDNLSKDIADFTEEQNPDLPVAIDGTLNRINNDVFALYGFFQNFMLLLQAQSGQLKPNLTTVNIPHLATNMLADYEPFAAANDIRLVNDVQNNVFVLADERLIDTVLRNMMSNAFKYVPAGGLITLGAKENYENMEIWVTDDGIGLTPEQSTKLFELTENLSLPGKPDLKGYGLGLAVCKALVETCKGRIWAETKPDEGFCIRFSLPKAENREIIKSPG